MRDDLPLIHALIDAYLVLELSGPDEMSSDTAVRAMENMASSLLSLEHADQLLLRAKFEHIAAMSEEQSYREFVRALPEHIGLAAE